MSRDFSQLLNNKKADPLAVVQSGNTIEFLSLETVPAMLQYCNIPKCSS
jgi:hypothetical protein